MRSIYAFLDANKVYERMDKILNERGMSIYALAKKAEISCAAVYKWRDGKTTPSLYLLKKISMALEVEMSYLLGDESAARVSSGEIDSDKFLKMWKELDEPKRGEVYQTIQSLLNKGK